MATTDTARSNRPPRDVPPAEPQESAGRRLVRRLFEPVDLGLIVLFRIGFGVIMLWEVWRYFHYGWIGAHYVAPRFHFTFYGFDWVRPWPGNGMYWHFAAMGVLAACIAAGLFYRVAAALFFVAFTWFFLIESSRYLNHFYLIAWVSLLMVFVPAHRAVSLDVLRKPSLYSPTAPRWALWLLRMQIGVAYFYGGLAKLNADWLAGEPMRGFLNSRFGFTPDGRFHPVPEAAVWFFTWGGLLFDLLIVPALLWHRTRVPAFCLAVAFHFTNDRLFNIGVFPWFMIVGTLLFCPPEWLQVGGEKTPTTADTPPRRLTGRQRLAVGLLGSYAAFQLLFPLRHYLYPGPVSWTEEGHYFAWHMKLRAKEAVAEFHAFDAQGQEIPVPPTHDLLTDRQAKQMACTPDMVVQYAHYLADVLRQQGHEPAAIRVSDVASLNGRPLQTLIDPQVNLLDVHPSLWPADWIVPLTTPLPPRGSLDQTARHARPSGGVQPEWSEGIE